MRVCMRDNHHKFKTYHRSSRTKFKFDFRQAAAGYIRSEADVMKVFLTSATGFIGAQIAAQLVSRGDTVGALGFHSRSV